jgi:hypothetical protein
MLALLFVHSMLCLPGILHEAAQFNLHVLTDAIHGLEAVDPAQFVGNLSFHPGRLEIAKIDRARVPDCELLDHVLS